MTYKSLFKGMFTSLLIASGVLLLFTKCSSPDKPKPPEVVYKLGDGEGSLVRLSDDSFMLFKMENTNLTSMVSSDGHLWSKPKVEIEFPSGRVDGLVLLDKEGELHNISMVRRNVPQKPGGLKGPSITLMIDLWHQKTIDDRSKWDKPKLIFEGYCGAVLDFKQLRSGRMIVPFAYWATIDSFPTGLNISTVVYSDDNGDTWYQSDAKITSPTYKGYPGNNYGAVEPGIVELAENSHLYMIMRTQTGLLYESYSSDNGTNWTPATASRFYSFNGPPLITNLPNNRIFMVWNNSDNAPTYKGQIVYGGRDAIHAAISEDYGKTWKGFREIHRDPLRNESPPKTGDRGTAYANSPIGVESKVMLITGMGENRRHIVSVDPDWLTAKHHESDFSKGLDEWTIFKQFGPVIYYWRDRCIGPRLVEHPSKNGVNVLHIRRPDENHGDGAIWNFPNGQSGKLSLHILLNEGFGGGSISLTDRFFNPTDDHGERLAMFSLPISEKGQLGQGPGISIGQWHTIDFIWDIDNKTCTVINDGKQALIMTQRNETLNGLSYLRLRSKSPVVDTAGYLIESVVVDIDDNTAPMLSKKDKQIFEADYRDKLSYDELSDIVVKSKTDSLKLEKEKESFY